MLAEGLLSVDAAAVYDRLLNAGKISMAEPVDGVTDAAVQELVVKKFARLTGGGDLVPVSPLLAMESALLAEERGIVTAHEKCLKAWSTISKLRQDYTNSARRRADDPSVSVVNAEEAPQLAVDLLTTARSEVLLFHTSGFENLALFSDSAWTVGEVSRLRSAGARLRCIYEKQFLELPQGRETVERFASSGLESKAIHKLPTPMVLVDSRVALVPLHAQEAAGAVMFRRGAATDLLRAAFELHWGRGAPLGAGPPAARASIQEDEPTDMQLRILCLLAVGMKDEAIARHLQVSLRTVRRNLTSLCEAVGAPTRFALAIVSAERGWTVDSGLAPPSATHHRSARSHRRPTRRDSDGNHRVRTATFDAPTKELT